MESFPNYHPMIVHFPIVLLLIAAAMQLASFFVKSRDFQWAILAIAVLGYASAYFAAAWRHPQMEREAVNEAVLLIFDDHQLFARWSVWLGGAGAALKAVEIYFRGRTLWTVLTALALLGSTVAVAVSGHYGAELVHKHGVGPKGNFLKMSKAAVAATVHDNPNAVENDTTPKSIRARAIGKIGEANVAIHYSSPKVRGRVIWGGLVPFGKVWATGANQATTIEFDRTVQIGDVPIAAGKYAFFSIPTAGNWTLILNKNWDQHLADRYDPKDDVLRLEVAPQPNTHTERLQYFLEPPANEGSEGAVSVAWELLKLRLPVKPQ